MQAIIRYGVSVRFDENFMFDTNNLSEVSLGPAYPIAKRMFNDINSSIKEDSIELKNSSSPGRVCCHMSVLIFTCGIIICPFLCWAYNLAKLQKIIKSKISSGINSYEVELRQSGYTAVLHNRVVYSRRRVSEGLPERIEITPIVPLNFGVVAGVNVMGTNQNQINEMQLKMNEIAQANEQMRSELDRLKNEGNHDQNNKNYQGKTQDINAPNPY